MTLLEFRLVSEGSTIQLQQTKFQHPLLDVDNGELVTVRGSGLVLPPPVGNFRWSQGVQALTAFFLRAASSDTSKASRYEPKLIGRAGTPAASMDYAISKSVNWLHDMFGTDSRGRSYIRRIVRRANADRKMPGPVELYLNDKVLPPAAIRVYLDDVRLTDWNELREMAERVEEAWYQQYKKNRRNASTNNIRKVEPVRSKPQHSLNGSSPDSSLASFVEHCIQEQIQKIVRAEVKAALEARPVR